MHKDCCIKAGGIVIGPGGKVLIVSQKGVSWSFPKGHLDEGEDILEGAKREIHEESGIEPSKLKLIQAYPSYERSSINGLAGHHPYRRIYLFLFTTTEEKLAPIDPDNPEAIWVDRDKVKEYLEHERDHQFFDDIKAGLPK